MSFLSAQFEWDSDFDTVGADTKLRRDLNKVFDTNSNICQLKNHT